MILRQFDCRLAIESGNLWNCVELHLNTEAGKKSNVVGGGVGDDNDDDDDDDNDDDNDNDSAVVEFPPSALWVVGSRL